jgi:hypothetical protein
MYMYQQSPPLHIEIASYALLYLVNSNQLPSGYPILQWLIAQRNSQGGFRSTQVQNQITEMSNCLICIENNYVVIERVQRCVKHHKQKRGNFYIVWSFVVVVFFFKYKICNKIFTLLQYFLQLQLFSFQYSRTLTRHNSLSY